MKSKIRNQVFETNSSSVHTIIFSNDGLEPSNLPVKDGMIQIDFGKFGKELNYYNSQYDKLSYLITCLYYLSSFGYDDIYNTYLFKEIQNTVCEYAGANGIEIIGDVEPSIDHQSQPYDDIELVNVYDKEELINFIFNKNILLKTDCD